MPLRIVFFGTPAFAVPSLCALAASEHRVVAAVTQPDRPRGRGQKRAAPEVKTAALERGIAVLQPDSIRTPEFLDTIAALQPDLGVVAAYGRILPGRLLAVPRLGMINVHASLLPRWRGAAPVHRAIIAGDTETGVTIMRVVEALDAGPMLARLPTPVSPNETSDELEARLADLGADLLIETVNALARGPVREEPQDDRLATYAHRLERRESAIDWNQPSLAVHNLIRGLQPWPAAAAMFKGRRVLLRRASPAPAERHGALPGTILRIDSDAVVVATAPGAVRLLVLQHEGRPPVPAAAFVNGARVEAGDRFEPLSPPEP